MSVKGSGLCFLRMVCICYGELRCNPLLPIYMFCVWKGSVGLVFRSKPTQVLLGYACSAFETDLGPIWSSVEPGKQSQGVGSRGLKTLDCSGVILKNQRKRRENETETLVKQGCIRMIIYTVVSTFIGALLSI